ncbi:MAG TPA: proton-conducting transporter membrane subunit [Myxococcota bacterium]|nr:proton-conducting transporter membrane subunit [Myxococcota bacterium]
MAIALVLAPLLFASIAFAVPSGRWRPWLLPVGAAVHLGLTCVAVQGGEVVALDGWLRIDPLSRLLLPLLSLLFFVCSLYAPGYLALRPERKNRVFCSALFAFLAMMTLITLSHHLGLMWVALEANTLASAPLLYFNHNARSVEATWKYLLIGAVGIALALLGSFFLAYAALVPGLETSLLFEDLVRQAPLLSRPWLRAAFVLLFVGYGTKMGLAPMHTWKPDAYGEAPGLVGALLAGGLTTCAFLALLRFYQVCSAAGEAQFARELMVAMGIVSMAVAAVFMARQRDFKRMLAYSSVEHMGILVLGIGIGGAATFGALFHVVNNALAKGILFLSAANIHRAFGSKTTDVVAGALRRVPVSGALFLAGFFAVTGSPPFAPFLSEFTILRATIEAGRYGVAAAFLVLLFAVFVGMGATVLAVVQGEPSPDTRETGFHDRVGTVAPILVLLALVTLLGVYVPSGMGAALWDAARFVEARP